MTENNLGERLKARRLETGLTFVDLEALSGVDKSYLGRIERGERSPSSKILRKLAEPLGFDESELLKMAGYLSPDKTDDRISRLKETMKVRHSLLDFTLHRFL